MGIRIRAWLKDEFGFLRGNFLILVASYVLSGFASGLNSPFRSNYIEGLGASVVEIGLISSVGSFISAVIAIPGAYIADKYGRRNIIVVFTYFVAAGYLIHAFAPNWWFILFGSIILNLSRVYLPALQAIEADSLPEKKRGMGYSLINMAPSIFSAVSPPIAGIIVSRYELVPGMRLLYLATTAIILIIALIRTFFLEETLQIKLVELQSLWSHIRDSVTSFKAAFKDMNRDIWSFTLLELLYSLEDPIFFLYLSLFVLQEVKISSIGWGYICS
ncbi:MAG: MFS transporter, partial [Candidatus Bathyarchaeota archaeon]